MNIREKVYEIIQNLCGKSNVMLNNELQKDLGLDSLMLVSLLIEIEEVFSIELDESDMNPFELLIVGDVIELVERYVEIE
mgnify:CR=1 FL=1